MTLCAHTRGCIAGGVDIAGVARTASTGRSSAVLAGQMFSCNFIEAGMILWEMSLDSEEGRKGYRDAPLKLNLKEGMGLDGDRRNTVFGKSEF